MKTRMRIILQRNHSAPLSLRLEISRHFSAFHSMTSIWDYSKALIILLLTFQHVGGYTYRPVLAFGVADNVSINKYLYIDNNLNHKLRFVITALFYMHLRCF